MCLRHLCHQLANLTSLFRCQSEKKPVSHQGPAEEWDHSENIVEISDYAKKDVKATIEQLKKMKKILENVIS